MTTHNLAPLTVALGLNAPLKASAPKLVERIFDGILRSYRQKPAHFRAQLQRVKNNAYAWRQAIFFLSLGELSEQRDALARLEPRVRVEAPLLHPAVLGLAQVIEGGRFDHLGRLDSGGRRFLGWSYGPHWLLPTL